MPRDAQGSWFSLVLSPVPGKWSLGQGREHFMKKQVLKGKQGGLPDRVAAPCPPQALCQLPMSQVFSWTSSRWQGIASRYFGGDMVHAHPFVSVISVQPYYKSILLTYLVSVKFIFKLI